MKALIATLMPGYSHANALDRVLSRSLVKRGVQVDLLVCNSAISACQMTKIGRIDPLSLSQGKRMPYCNKCISANESMMDDLWNVIYLSDFLHDESHNDVIFHEDVNSLRKFKYRNVDVVEHAYAGTLRYLARGDLNDDYAREIFHFYIKQSLILVDKLISLFTLKNYDVVVVNHGIYIPQGVLVNVAENFGVRVVTYNPSYKKQTFIFSHKKSYHYTMLNEPEKDWLNYDLNAEKDNSLSKYLYSRRSGVEDWIWFHNEPIDEYGMIMKQIGADLNVPIVTALTSVVWDAQLHYSENVFDNMLDWIFFTIDEWQKKECNTQLIIRIHPAEIRGQVPSRQKVHEEIAARYPTLPKNIFIVPPENEASTYTLCDKSLAVIVYNTKTGAEIGASNIPVLVAGEAWIRNKGIGVDIKTKEMYSKLISNIESERLETNAARGRKYAYHFFFRRMIPLPFLVQNNSGGFDIVDNDFYVPGKYKGLDVICNGIINGSAFIYDE